MKQLIINALTTEKRAALLENGKLIEYLIEQPNLEKLLPGDIYLAQIDKIDKKIAAAFLTIDRKKAFIHLKDFPKTINPTQGAKIPVMIVREGTKTKLPLATAFIEISSDFFIYIFGNHHVSVSKRLNDTEKTRLTQIITPELNKNEAVIIRSAAENLSKETLINHLDEIKITFKELQKKIAVQKKTGLISQTNHHFLGQIEGWIKRYHPGEIICDNRQLKFENAIYKYTKNIFKDYKIESQIKQLSRPIVRLANGASLVIEKTEAMWVIDINSGQFNKQLEKDKVIMQINTEALPEIMRQIRLRNLSGLIVIDFIGQFSEKTLADFKDQAEAVVLNEYITTQIAGLTKSGLMQITRRKKTKSLLEETHSLCSLCHGNGYVESATTCAYRLERELTEIISTDVDYINIISTEAVLKAFHDLNTLNDFPLNFEIANQETPFYQISRIK
ncbi:ribonuclease E/G [Listeria sp. PSOL-1]|uniref:ribonuclease E/G n=1 Tax=Listeria sp. PSOL-1 TaxID=1844999 RepID=UPI0013CFC297|nr:ribonuclease E/G [Listeria sp. PSOL-1]